jgi:ABC-2 type transport system permease protein
MWRAAVLVGRSISDVLAAALCVTVAAITALAIGWRTGGGLALALAGFAVV